MCARCTACLALLVTLVAAAGAAVHRHRHHAALCVDYEPSWKAVRADVVAVAAYESRSLACDRDLCPMDFVVDKWLKPAGYGGDPVVRIPLRTNRTTGCEDGARRGQAPPYVEPYFVVPERTDSKRYLLYLKVVGLHKYTALFSPELNKTKAYKAVTRANHMKDYPLPHHQILEKRGRKRVKLVCRLNGFPIPKIQWTLDGKLIRPNNRTTYRTWEKKNRYKSTLVIKSPNEREKLGVYGCSFNWVDTKPHTISTSKNEIIPCDDKTMMKAYCFNGGSCRIVKPLHEPFCECPLGFEGKRCDTKTVENRTLEREKRDEEAGRRNDTTIYQRNLQLRVT